MKTQKVDGVFTVAEVGHASIRMMAWESPFVVFDAGDFGLLVWHSENVAEILRRFGFRHGFELRGAKLGVVARVRPADRPAADGRPRWRVQRVLELRRGLADQVAAAFVPPVEGGRL